jgi:hypothetical protein
MKRSNPFQVKLGGKMEEIFITSDSPDDSYQCVVEGDNYTVWMYLYNYDKKEIVADSAVCSLSDPITYDEFKRIFKKGDTPRIVKEYASKQAIIKDMKNSRLSIKWADNNISVVVMIDDEPFSMIIKDKKPGFSKAIENPCPWANPWDEDLYKQEFGEME